MLRVLGDHSERQTDSPAGFIQTHSAWLCVCVRIQWQCVKYSSFLELSASWDTTPTDMANKSPELCLRSPELGF